MKMRVEHIAFSLNGDTAVIRRAAPLQGLPFPARIEMTRLPKWHKPTFEADVYVPEGVESRKIIEIVGAHSEEYQISLARIHYCPLHLLGEAIEFRQQLDEFKARLDSLAAQVEETKSLIQSLKSQGGASC